MYAQASLRPFRTTSVILAALVLAACGQGSGPDSIPGTLVPPPGPCDSIDFEADSDCPQPGIVNFGGGATILVDNPDKSGINTSDRVARMQKFPDQPFGGTLLELGEPIDFSQGEFYKVKVWSPRPVAVTFKLEEQGNSEGGLADEQGHPGGSAWEELCFDFAGQNVPPPVVALTIIFDNGTLGQADTDPDNWTFFYDDITQVESCAAGPSASIIPDVALTGADPDLVIPDDYEEITAFGSGSVIDPLYADDETFSPVLSVFSGTGYGANVAQVGFIGFPAGFLTDYETVDFKVKGMPNLVIFVKLFDGVDALRLNLTRSDFSTDLGDGWYQVSIPVSRFSDAELGTGIVFESDNTAPMQFRMLLTDVGFSGTGTRVPADAGIIPDVTLFDRDGMPDLVFGVDYTEISTFGSGADLEDDFRGDIDFRPAWAVTTGFGYEIWNAQLAYLGFAPGFAASYLTLDFKVKGLSGDVIRVKFLDDTNPPYVDINVTSSAFSTALGNGWYQVSVPIAAFEGVTDATGLLFETVAPAPAESFTYLMTDIGFSGSRVPADPGIIPDVTLFDRDGTPDLVFGVDYTEISAFGSGADLDDGFRGDPDFQPAWSVTTGFGYGIWNAQLAYLGFAPGFASSYETLDFKVKGLSGNVIRLKFLNQPDPPYVDINVTTSAYSTALGNGWYQVSVPITEFAGVDTSGALLFETIAPPPADSFTYLLTDIGFSGEAPVDTTTSVGFEGDPDSYSFTDFGGGASTVIANPDQSGINTTGQAVQMTRTSESNFGGSTLALPDGVDWGQGDIFRMKVWSQRPVPVLFKIEGNPPAERAGDHDGGGVWQELCFDFTGDNAGAPVTGISIFFDLGVTPDPADDPANWTFYYDEIQQSNEGCPVDVPLGPVDFEPEGLGQAFAWTVFENADNPPVEVIANPDASGANTSANVARFTARAGGQAFAGAFTLDLPTFTLDATNSCVKIKVWKPVVSDVGIKFETGTQASTGEIKVANTVTNQWEELSFDFSGKIGEPESTDIANFILFPDFAARAQDNVVYFDDIRFLDSSQCGGAADHGPGTAGVFTETATESIITVTSITNSADFGGNNTVADPASTAIPAFEGDVVLAIDYQNSSSTFGGVILNFGGVDLTAYDTLNLTVDTSGIAGFADLTIQIEPPGAGAAGTKVLLSAYTPVATSGNWATYAIPLADFPVTNLAAAANLGFWNPVDGGAALAFGTLYVDDVFFSTEGGGGDAVEIAVNGGFETGDFTGWTQFEATPGDQTVNTGAVGDTSSEGVYHVEINNTATGTNSLIKQERVGLGIVTPGAAWTVTFDARGSFGAGGVAFAQVFSETAGGNENCSGCGILGGAPLALNADPTVWTSFSFSGTAGPNTESLTLQLEAVTGGGDLANVFYDNISIVVGNGGG